jgi:hypothetical protein
VVAFDAGRLSGPTHFGHHHVDAARSQVHRRRQSNGAGTYHEHWGLYFLHSFSFSSPDRPDQNILQVPMVQISHKILINS